MSRPHTETDRLVGLLSHVLDEVDDETYLYYLDVQKVFYYLQKQLDADNTISQQLAYYWYLDGPVSDEVQETADRARELGAVETESTKEGLRFKRAKSGPELEFTDEDYVAAEAALDRVLKEDYHIHSSLGEKLNDVYRDAPYDFQPFYKFEVLDAVDEYDQGFPWAYSPEEILNLIATAEAYLPTNDSFEEVNTMFSRFVTTAEQYLSNVEGDRTGSGSFDDLAYSCWKLFCYRLRMVEHDPEYDSKLDQWESDYQMKLSSFEDEIKQFREFVNEEFSGASNEVHYRSDADSEWASVVSGIQEDD